MTYKFNCKWASFPHKKYEPSWIRRFIFRLCGDNWKDLAVNTTPALIKLTGQQIYQGFWCVRGGDAVYVEYTDHKGEYHVEQAVVKERRDITGDNSENDVYMLGVQFNKPVVIPDFSEVVIVKMEE